MAYNEKYALMANITAIYIAFRIRREGRTATPLETEQLRQYSGFGGIRSVLLDPARPDTWPKGRLSMLDSVRLLHETIRSHVTDDAEFDRIISRVKESTATAFYTPQSFISTLGATLATAIGGVPRTLLEPSAGHGRFLHLFDGVDGADAVRSTAFEKDILTGTVLSALHPSSRVNIRGFEEIPEAELGSFDMVVSNIPFGAVRVYDPALSRSKDPARRQATHSLHNYFFVKALDAVRNGGLVVFVTSRGVAESDANRPVREYLVRHANLVSGIRLPDDMFRSDGIDEVGTDLLIFQRNDAKRELSDDERLFIESSDLQYTTRGHDEPYDVVDLQRTHARNHYFNQDAANNYIWEECSTEHKHSIGLPEGDGRDRFGNPYVQWSVSEYWEPTLQEELASHLTRDFGRNYDRVLAMQANAPHVADEQLAAGDPTLDESYSEYPLYVPEPDEYTGYLRDGALVMQHGELGFILQQGPEGRQQNYFVAKRLVLPEELVYVQAYLKVRHAYYRLFDTEKNTGQEQPELRRQLGEAFPPFFELYDRYRGWQNNGRRVSEAVNHDLLDYYNTVTHDIWSWFPKSERKPGDPPYRLSDIFYRPVSIEPSQQASPAAQAQAEEVMSLYDLFGFSAEERTQIKTPSRRNRGRGAAASVSGGAAAKPVAFAPAAAQPVPYPLAEDDFLRSVQQAHWRSGTPAVHDGLAGCLESRTDGLWFIPMAVQPDADTLEAMQAYTAVRDTYWHLHDFERDRQTAADDVRARLNQLYDGMTTRFGGLRKERIASVAVVDPDYTAIAAIERYDDGRRVKADIFSEPVAFRLETEQPPASPRRRRSCSRSTCTVACGLTTWPPLRVSVPTSL